MASDGFFPLYRHRATGLTVPFHLPRERPENLDPATREKLRILADQYDCIGEITEGDFRRNLALLLTYLPPETQVFILLQCEKVVPDGQPIPPRSAVVNRWIRDTCTAWHRVTLIDTGDYVHDRSDLGQDGHAHHFNRMVYYRIYQDIARQIQGTTRTL
jgi:hypothetical protein